MHRVRHRLVRLLGHVNPSTLETSASRGNVCARRTFSTAGSDTDSVLATVSDGVGTIILNRPKALNALTLEMVRSLHGVLKRWRDDPEVRLVVMKGAGGKAFCAGGDVVTVRRSILEHPDPTPGVQGKDCADFFREEYQLDYDIFTARKPQVSVWDGFVMGGGVGLSMGSKFRVATERTVFSMPETAIGLFPDVGGTYWLPRLPGGLGMYLGLTGHRMKAADLLYSGIATHYIPSDRMRDVERALRDLGGRLDHSGSAKEVDRVLRRFIDSLDTSKAPLALHRAAIDRAFQGQETMESIVAHLQSCLPDPWAEATLKTLSKMSPTSLKITFRAIKEGAKLPLEENFIVEYRLTQGCMHKESDFVEGVRALLVDKDNSPKWQPTTLAKVTEEHVDRFFTPLGDLDLRVGK